MNILIYFGIIFTDTFYLSRIDEGGYKIYLGSNTLKLRGPKHIVAIALKRFLKQKNTFLYLDLASDQEIKDLAKAVTKDDHKIDNHNKDHETDYLTKNLMCSEYILCGYLPGILEGEYVLIDCSFRMDNEFLAERFSLNLMLDSSREFYSVEFDKQAKKNKHYLLNYTTNSPFQLESNGFKLIAEVASLREKMRDGLIYGKGYIKENDQTIKENDLGNEDKSTNINDNKNESITDIIRSKGFMWISMAVVCLIAILVVYCASK